MMKNPWHAIEKLYQSGRYAKTRERIEALYGEWPDDFYALTMIASTYYEQRDYERAFAYSIKAMRLGRRDPLVIWNHAGILSSLDRHWEAIRLYRRLLRMGAKRAGTVACTEGVRWAESLLNDVRFCLADCLLAVGRTVEADRGIKMYLRFCDSGVATIYGTKTVGALAKRIAKAIAAQKRASKASTQVRGKKGGHAKGDKMPADAMQGQ